MRRGQEKVLMLLGGFVGGIDRTQNRNENHSR
jgi:hypothetical protein